MAFNWGLKVPYQYRTTYKTLREMEAILLAHYHPEYVRRMLAWLHYHNGYVGIGGHWRDDGTQPDKPGFAPEGRSFHQNQKHADGWIGPSAVDTIVVDGPDPGDWHDGISWDDVPIQDSAEADVWGLHANVDGNGNPGAPGTEAWHIQWADEHIGGYDLDGWVSWNSAGQPAIIRGYPIPAEHDPYGTDTGDDDMAAIDPVRLYDSRQHTALAPGQPREIRAVSDQAFVSIAAGDATGPGFISISPTSTPNDTSLVNYQKGPQYIANSAPTKTTSRKFWVTAHVSPCHVVVDQYGS